MKFIPGAVPFGPIRVELVVLDGTIGCSAISTL